MTYLKIRMESDDEGDEVVISRKIDAQPIFFLRSITTVHYSRFSVVGFFCVCVCGGREGGKRYGSIVTERCLSTSRSSSFFRLCCQTQRVRV